MYVQDLGTMIQLTLEIEEAKTFFKFMKEQTLSEEDNNFITVNITNALEDFCNYFDLTVWNENT